MPKSMKKLVTKGAAVIKKTKVKKKPPRMTGDEKRLVREMHFERKMPPTDIAAAVGRDLSGICRLLAQKKAPKPMGRPRALTEGQVDKTIKTLEAMIDEASAKREVTLAMVMRRCRLKVCDRVVADALHARGYWFHKLRTKMILTPDDVKDRFAWPKKYKGKNRHWWQKRIQVHLDNHHFKHATTSKGRALLAKRLVRGAYRTKTKSLPRPTRPSHTTAMHAHMHPCTHSGRAPPPFGAAWLQCWMSGHALRTECKL